MNGRASRLAKWLTAFAVMLGTTLAGVTGPAQALEAPVSVTGSVLDAGTATGIAGASVDAYDPTTFEGDFATTDASGNYAMELVPGNYEFYAYADGYNSTTTTFEVTASTTTIPPIELEPDTSSLPGIHVSVMNETIGGAAPNATVSLQPAGGGAATEQVTDSSGQTVFTGLANGQYTAQVLAKDGFLGSDPTTVDYTGGILPVSLSTTVDLKCEPASANTGLTNMGFESNLDGWTLGFRTESIQAITADTFTSPWEGSKMARLGVSQPSDGETQPQGPNILCQDFVVDQAEERFSFNIFTYDYTGFDEFAFDVIVTSPATGETLAAYRQEAWGASGDTTMKTSGWRGVKLDLADHMGETVRLNFRSGGTSDQLYAFWTYLDSAATLPPVVTSTVTDFQSETGSVTTDPVTGQVTVAMPVSDPSDLTMVLPAKCEAEGVTPTSVRLLLDGTPFEATPVGDGKYSVTIPEASIDSGQLMLEVVCEGAATLIQPVGQIVLYDPSGIVSDAVTGAPVVGAEVTLYKVPGWTPQGETGPYPANTCQSNLSKPAGEPWSQPAPTDLGQVVNPASPEISPNVNPFVTNNVGYYGWDVAEGCWYVVVEADGYQKLTSPVVGVPPEVTDLDLKLEPTPIANTAKPVVSGTAKVGETLNATPGTWDTDGLGFAYQWLRDGTPIAGATAPAYAVTIDDANKALAVQVTASKAGKRDVSATSATVAVPKVATKPKLKIARKVAQGTVVKAVVIVKTAAAGPATGKVVVKVGKKVFGKKALKNGKAKIKLKKFKKLKPGKYKVKAIYKGSDQYAKSVSKKKTVKVVR